MYQFGFLGCGNMGTALASAVAKTGATLALSGANWDKCVEKAKKLSAVPLSNGELAQSCRFIVLGVKPQKMGEVLAEIAPVLRSRKESFCIITMAAGITMDSICEMLGNTYPVIRIMPNTPSEIGQGMILYNQNQQVSPEDIQAFQEGFAPAGMLESLEESLIDAGSAISGCGPAFAYMFVEALADGGVKCGLPRSQALRFAAKTLMGSGAMVLETGRHPGALKDAVCSPGGSTIEGVKALESAGFRSAVLEAVTAAYEKTVKLGKK